MIITHMHYTLPPHKRAEEGRPGEKKQCVSGRVGTPLPFSSTLLNPLPWPHDERAEGGRPGEKKTSVGVKGFWPLYPSLVHPPHPPLESKLFSPTPWFLTFKFWHGGFNTSSKNKHSLLKKYACYTVRLPLIYHYEILPQDTRRL